MYSINYCSWQFLQFHVENVEQFRDEMFYEVKQEYQQGIIIKSTNSIKYLGIIIDQQLRWGGLMYVV